MNITEILVQPQAVAWLPWAVQYFFYIGSAYAAAILFVIALKFDQQSSHRLRAALVLTMAIGAVVGPLALTGDLHQPGRAWHFYVYFTPWSWMSLGSLLLPVFSGLAIITAWLYLRNDLMKLSDSQGKVFRWISKLTLGQWQISPKHMLVVSLFTALSGLTIAVYTGAEIMAVHSRPLWNQPASPLFWFVSAFLGAVGFTLFVWLLFPNKSKQDSLTSFDLNLLKKVVSLSSVLSLVLVPIWASNNQTFSLYLSNEWVHQLAMISVLMLLSVVWGMFCLREHYSKTGLLLMALLALGAAWVVRWVTMMQVQTIAKYDIGPIPYQLSLGSDGLLGIVGMFGLWLALALLASELVSSSAPRLTSTHQ